MSAEQKTLGKRRGSDSIPNVTTSSPIVPPRHKRVKRKPASAKRSPIPMIPSLVPVVVVSGATPPISLKEARPKTRSSKKGKDLTGHFDLYAMSPTHLKFLVEAFSGPQPEGSTTVSSNYPALLEVIQQCQAESDWTAQVYIPSNRNAIGLSGGRYANPNSVEEKGWFRKTSPTNARTLDPKYPYNMEIRNIVYEPDLHFSNEERDHFIVGTKGFDGILPGISGSIQLSTPKAMPYKDIKRSMGRIKMRKVWEGPHDQEGSGKPTAIFEGYISCGVLFGKAHQDRAADEGGRWTEFAFWAVRGASPSLVA